MAEAPHTVVVGGGIAGLALYQRMTNRQFQAAVSVLLMVSGLGLLSRSL